MAFEQKTIVITGVTRGLGRALTNIFSTLGHTVIGCGRDTTHIQELQKSPGPSEYFTALDITNEESVNAWATATIAQVGPPDIVINNAAIINENLPFWEIPTEDFDRIIDVNLKGVSYVMHAFLPAMLLSENGIIINLSSGYGSSTSSGVAPYCCTKFGIEGLTQALAHDLPPGLAAIPLSPGIIHTDMLQKTFGDSAQSYEGPDAWAEKAAPYILNLTPQHNGQSLRIPQ